jgi:hypothetical protein
MSAEISQFTNDNSMITTSATTSVSPPILTPQFLSFRFSHPELHGHQFELGFESSDTIRDLIAAVEDLGGYNLDPLRAAYPDPDMPLTHPSLAEYRKSGGACITIHRCEFPSIVDRTAALEVFKSWDTIVSLRKKKEELMAQIDKIDEGIETLEKNSTFQLKKAYGDKYWYPGNIPLKMWLRYQLSQSSS